MKSEKRSPRRRNLRRLAWAARRARNELDEMNDASDPNSNEAPPHAWDATLLMESAARLEAGQKRKWRKKTQKKQQQRLACA